MKRTIAVLSGVVALGGIAALLSTEGEAQSTGSFVALQAATPGTAQAGNFRISGTGMMGGFRLGAAATAGRVLTTDASGTGTWQSLPATLLTLPYSGSVASASCAFDVTNTTSSALCGTRGAAVTGPWADPAIVGTSTIGNGVVGATSAGNMCGIYGSASGTSGAAGCFYATNGSIGAVISVTTGNGDGLRVSTAGAGDTVTATATTGFGVVASSNSGIGVNGSSTSGAGGNFSSTNSYGLIGTHTADSGLSSGWQVSGARGETTTGVGVLGLSSFSGGAGTVGASSGGANSTGVNATGTNGSTGLNARSTGGKAVKAFSDINNEAGIFQSGGSSGAAWGGFQFALWGDTDDGNGTLGATSAAFGFGTMGWARGSATTAGYFSGNTIATGTKSFMIDDPRDPEDKVIVHYCTESPAPQNMYNGTVTMDSNGEAWVQLPDYFETINKDPQYQLTCVGGYAQVYIADEIANNRFRIAGGRPGLKVSWIVYGIRNDPWVKKHGYSDVQKKTGQFQGRLLRPELYGQKEDTKPPVISTKGVNGAR